MKTLNKIMFIACLIFAIICLPVTLIVSAKGAEINQVSDVNTAWETIKTDFVIQKGASIRLTDDTTSGLRFATTISKANEQSFNALKDKGLEIGILIMPRGIQSHFLCFEIREQSLFAVPVFLIRRLQWQ